MNKKKWDYIVFILTHGRPDRVTTYQTLRDRGYTGEIYLIIDDEDKTGDEYIKKYGDHVIKFSKSAIVKKFDQGDNFKDRRTIIYARNACFDIAESLGYEYFIELDDDYQSFEYKYKKGFIFGAKDVKSLDDVFKLTLNYYKKINVSSIAFAQGGDYMGGASGTTSYKRIPRRKAMNSFFCSTKRPFKFIGRINEDVNTYIKLGNKGFVFFSILYISIVQRQTQEQSGGMTGTYLDSGTYIKSFYTVMYNPSCVKIRMMGTTQRRIHHKINWKNAVPKIISEEYKK